MISIDAFMFGERRVLLDEDLKLGWDRVHKLLGITKPFYDRFTPAISVRDFALRRGNLDRALDFVAVLRP